MSGKTNGTFYSDFPCNPLPRDTRREIWDNALDTETYDIMEKLGLFCDCPESTETISALRRFITNRESTRIVLTDNAQSITRTFGHYLTFQSRLESTAHLFTEDEIYQTLDLLERDIAALIVLEKDRVKALSTVASSFEAWKAERREDHSTDEGCCCCPTLKRLRAGMPQPDRLNLEAVTCDADAELAFPFSEARRTLRDCRDIVTGAGTFYERLHEREK